MGEGGLKSQIENACGGGDGESRRGKGDGEIEIADGKRSGRWDGDRGVEEGGLKSQIENAGEERMGRGGWTEEGGLKSQIAKCRGGKDGQRGFER